jgi:hypothetical protein
MGYFLVFFAFFASAAFFTLEAKRGMGRSTI